MLGSATAMAVVLVCGSSATALAAAVQAHWDVWNGAAFRRAADFGSDFTTGDAGNGTWQLLSASNGVPELGFIKTQATGTGTVEVHVDTLQGGVFKRVLATGSDFSPGDAGNGVFELFGSVNGFPELGFIKLRNTGSGTVEVHWDVWNGSAYRRAGDYTSDFSPADAGNGTWQLLPTSTATPELGFIKTRSTGTGTVEVHLDTLQSGVYRRVLSTGTDFGAADGGNGVWQLFGSVNGYPELGFIKLRNIGSGTVEAHWDAWNGSAYRRAADYTSDFSPALAGDGAWQLVPTSNVPELGFVQLAFPAPPAAPSSTPPVPPAGSSPVQSAPVVVRAPTPHGRRHVKALIRFSWSWDNAHTRLHWIRFRRLPRAAKISVTCQGRGCPRPLAVTARVRKMKDLERALRGQRYRVGDQLLITISARGRLPERIGVSIRYGEMPRIQLL